MLWFGGILVSLLSFWMGKILSQSEKVIEQKKSVYEDFLKECPTASDAHRLTLDDLEIAVAKGIEKKLGVLALYASSDVLMRVQEYLHALEAATSVLSTDSSPMTVEFQKAAKAYNRMIFYMRKDALGWSIFGVSGKPEQGDLLSVPDELKE